MSLSACKHMVSATVMQEVQATSLIRMGPSGPVRSLLERFSCSSTSGPMAQRCGPNLARAARLIVFSHGIPRLHLQLVLASCCRSCPPLGMNMHLLLGPSGCKPVSHTSESRSEYANEH